MMKAKEKDAKIAKRKRVKRACIHCRVAKVSCSNSRPCLRCVRLNLTDTCIYPPRTKTLSHDIELWTNTLNYLMKTNPNQLSAAEKKLLSHLFDKPTHYSNILSMINNLNPPFAIPTDQPTEPPNQTNSSPPQPSITPPLSYTEHLNEVNFTTPSHSSHIPQSAPLPPTAIKDHLPPSQFQQIAHDYLRSPFSRPNAPLSSYVSNNIGTTHNTSHPMMVNPILMNDILQHNINDGSKNTTLYNNTINNTSNNYHNRIYNTPQSSEYSRNTQGYNNNDNVYNNIGPMENNLINTFRQEKEGNKEQEEITHYQTKREPHIHKGKCCDITNPNPYPPFPPPFVCLFSILITLFSYSIITIYHPYY